MSSEDKYPLDEFVSFRLLEDREQSRFKIVLEGPMKYSYMIGHKVCNLEFDDEEIAYSLAVEKTEHQ